ncbi:alpha/beta hydrolase-fold protein [Dermatophilaceae bacterium Sec6.4]
MFEPNSTVVVWALWGLAVLGVIGICWLWPRLANRGVTPVLGRALSQVVASTLVVLAVGGLLNQQNGWYGSWTDLGNDILGNPPVIAHQALRGHLQYTQHFDSQAARRTDQRAQQRFGVERATFQRTLGLHTKSNAQGQAQGQYVSVVVPGLGLTGRKDAGKVTVWLPPSYATGSQSTTYPVIEAFSGISGSPRDYQTKVKFQDIIAMEHQRFGLVEPIVIIPDYNPSALDTECVNSPGVPMETWVTQTIPTWVLHHLRARPDRGSWAALGYSAGAFCAEVSAVLNPQQYGALLIFGGYNHPEWGSWLPFGKLSAWPERYNILKDLRVSPPPIDVWIEQSEADPESLGEAKHFIQAVRAPTSVTTIALKGAGHRFDVWRGVMPDALKWLAKSEPAFQSRVVPPDVRLPSASPVHPSATAPPAPPSKPGPTPSNDPTSSAPYPA